VRVRFKGAGGLEQRISQGSGSLRVGSEYTVLEIFAQADGANFLRIEYSETELPPLFDSRMFEVASGWIPKAWNVSVRESGTLTFGPEDWSRPGFWEAFMDREEWTSEIYRVGCEQSLEGPG
jgi:hypothetical protein